MGRAYPRKLVNMQNVSACLSIKMFRTKSYTLKINLDIKMLHDKVPNYKHGSYIY